MTHKTIPVWVQVDVDEGIAEMVKYLQTIPGVRTHASCQGTLSEGGPNPYPPQVMVTWDSDQAKERLMQEFDFSPNGDWAYIHPKGTLERYVPSPTPISSKVFTFPYLVTLQLDEEQDVIARIPELPGCTAHGADVEEALRYLKEVMDLWLEENRLAHKEHE